MPKKRTMDDIEDPSAKRRAAIKVVHQLDRGWADGYLEQKERDPFVGAPLAATDQVVVNLRWMRSLLSRHEQKATAVREQLGVMSAKLTALEIERNRLDAALTAERNKTAAHMLFIMRFWNSCPETKPWEALLLMRQYTEETLEAHNESDAACARTAQALQHALEDEAGPML